MNLVTIKQGEHYYIVPMHEFTRYWIHTPLELTRLPNNLPSVVERAALERGERAYHATKGSERNGRPL